MAINKNFVVKNGIQVGDGLIYGDSATGNVGVGTTLPLSTLDVRGRINSVSVASTNLSVSGVSTLSTVIATTGNLTTLNVTTGNIVTGVVTTLSGTTATYGTGNLTTLNANTGNIVTGVITTLSGTTANYTNISIGSSLTVTGKIFLNGQEVSAGIGTTTNMNVNNINVIGVLTAPTINTQNVNSTGVITATSFVGNLTGTATGLSGTPNITVGVATATSFVGNLTGTATGLSGTPNITVGVATATKFVGSAQVGVATGGTYIGLATQFNFVGSGISVTHAYNSTAGIATITLFSSGTSAAGGGSGAFNTGISSCTGYAITSSMATAYTAPSTAGDEYIVHSIHVTNIDGTNSADVSGQMYAGAYSIAHLVPVPAGSSVELLKQPKVLAPNETIQLQASADNRLHATITVERKASDTSYVGVGTDITASATYTDLWTATANSVLQSVLLANDDGTVDVKARVVWTNGSNTIQGYYAYDMTVPADATVEVLEQPKYLPSGFKVRVYANVGNRLEAILAARTIA